MTAFLTEVLAQLLAELFAGYWRVIFCVFAAGIFIILTDELGWTDWVVGLVGLGVGIWWEWRAAEAASADW